MRSLASLIAENHAQENQTANKVMTKPVIDAPVLVPAFMAQYKPTHASAKAKRLG
jgi:hypothetical protein